MKRLPLGELRVARVISKKEFLVSDAFPSLERAVGLLVA
jgi:hypothetical protein